MRLLVLVTDAFGGRGGIAKFNRDLLESLCAHPAATEIVAIPRVIVEPPSAIPDKLLYDVAGAEGKLSFVRQVLLAARSGTYDGIICGHVNLMPLAWYTARRLNVPLLLVVHGIEAWQPPTGWLTRMAIRHSAAVVSVSEFTKRRFLGWTKFARERVHVVPNCVDAAKYGIGRKRHELIERYGIADRTVLLTLGRLAGAERYKGFDEVIGILPTLARDIPSISYLIVGEGRDKRRLECRARELGVRDRVIFAGYASEEDKADHYRLADAYVMPSRGEGFGIVYLEALACGIPVVASTADASREAVLDGEMGEVTNPDSPADLEAAIHRALARERVVPPGLSRFSVAQFRSNWSAVLDEVFSPRVAQSQ